MLCVMLPAMICRLPFKMIFGLSFALFWSFWLFGTHIFSSCFFNSYYIAKLPLKVWMLHSPCLPVSYFFTYLFTAFSCGKQTTFFIQGCHILYIWARIIYAAPAISTKMGYWIFFRDPHAKRWSPNACPCRYSIPASLQQRRDMLRKSRALNSSCPTSA